MSNFSTFKYVSIHDIFKLIYDYKYKVNLIYKNDNIELKFENVKIFLKDGYSDNCKYTEITASDNTAARNMSLCMKARFKCFYLDSEKSKNGKLYLMYNENIGFEVIEVGSFQSNVYVNKKKYDKKIELTKKENEFLKILPKLKICSNEAGNNHKKIFRKEENLIKEETFKFVPGKRKVFYDPRYGFKAEGCYNDNNIEFESFGEEIEFSGRDEMYIKLNSNIFRQDSKEVYSYSVIKENVDELLWKESRQSDEDAIDKYTELANEQKKINTINKLGDLYIIEFEENTEDIEKVLFKKEPERYDSYYFESDWYDDYDDDCDEPDFGALDDDGIPF